MSVYGLVAEFDSADALLDAVKVCRQRGLSRLDAYTPFPIEGLAEALGFEERRLSYIALAGGLIGGIGGYLMVYGMNAVDYPINVGGRPLNAWPAFAVPAFEMLVLGAALAVLIGMMALNGLPRLHHPAFDIPDFRRVSLDRFFLLVRTDDAAFDDETIRALLNQADAKRIAEAPA
jgi:hypothetical protein